MINGLRDGLMINGLRDALMITRWFWPILADYGKFRWITRCFADGCFDGLRDALTTDYEMLLWSMDYEMLWWSRDGSGLFWQITGCFDGLRDALICPHYQTPFPRCQILAGLPNFGRLHHIFGGLRDASTDYEMLWGLRDALTGLVAYGFRDALTGLVAVPLITLPPITHHDCFGSLQLVFLIGFTTLITRLRMVNKCLFCISPFSAVFSTTPNFGKAPSIHITGTICKFPFVWLYWLVPGERLQKQLPNHYKTNYQKPITKPPNHHPTNHHDSKKEITSKTVDQ